MMEDRSFAIGSIVVNGKIIRLVYAGSGSQYFIRYDDGSEGEHFDGLCQAFAFMQRTWGLDIIGSTVDWNKPIKLRPLI